jgi:hypothetical protein
MCPPGKQCADYERVVSLLVRHCTNILPCSADRYNFQRLRMLRVTLELGREVTVDAESMREFRGLGRR